MPTPGSRGPTQTSPAPPRMPAGLWDPLTAAFAVVKGVTQPLDIVSVLQVGGAWLPCPWLLAQHCADWRWLAVS